MVPTSKCSLSHPNLAKIVDFQWVFFKRSQFPRCLERHPWVTCSELPEAVESPVRREIRIVGTWLRSVVNLPSGEPTKSNGKIHHFSWENTHYFDWAIFQFAFCMFTRPGKLTTEIHFHEFRLDPRQIRSKMTQQCTISTRSSWWWDLPYIHPYPHCIPPYCPQLWSSP